MESLRVVRRRASDRTVGAGEEAKAAGGAEEGSWRLSMDMVSGTRQQCGGGW